MNQLDVYQWLGVWANAFTLDSLLDTIGASRTTPLQVIIGHHNLRSIYLYHHDPKAKEFFDRAAKYIFIDGMPFLLWGWALGYSLRRENRLTGVDWMPPFMARAAADGWRVFYLGSKPGVAETGAQKFREQNPGLMIKTRHGYFEKDEENQAVIDMINAWSPDVLLVGMGMPRQEYWILDYHQRLNAKCIIPVGATMDYFAGVIPTPPRWMGRVGLEWLARLWAEPRRLARRYLIEPWFLLPYMMADLRKRRKREVDG
jgi:N-acetylglucosaminyldiphosphoundecaprenol N-acetyl-beta-D-mannosaminyltransferase